MRSVTAFENGWFALSVKPRHEKTVARALQARELESFLPLHTERRVWSDRVKPVEFPLFSGYVFCRFAYSDRLAVLNTPGVNSIVGEAFGLARIPDGDIIAIRAIVESGLPANPCTYVARGQMVRVEHGPLAGIRGTVVRSCGATCVVVSIEILQRSVVAQLERGSIRPLQVTSSSCRPLSVCD